MNDTLREYMSYGSFLVPLLRVKKIIQPQKVQWGNKDQYFLHYPSDSSNHNLVIYIHGGGWNSGSPSAFHFIGQKFALEGYDCIMPGYRKAPRYHFGEIIDDIFRGYGKITEYLSGNKLEYEKTYIIGSSAGAHLGALLCYDREMQERYAISMSTVNGFVSLAGPLCFDFPQTSAQNQLMKGLFASKDLSVWKIGEPLSKLERGQTTPMLIVQCRHDGVIGFHQAAAFGDRAIELGIPAELYEVAEARNTHSAYSAGIFLQDRENSSTLNKIFEWIS